METQKQTSTIRSVLNHEEFTREISSITNGRPKHVKEYVKIVARKYFLKNWNKFCKVEGSYKGPKFFGLKTVEGVPYDKLTVIIRATEGPIIKQIEQGSEFHKLLTRGDLVLLDLDSLYEIRNELIPILDWMTSVYRQPRDLTAIAYNTAKEKAKKWHEEQVRIAKKQSESEREKLAVASIAGTRPVFEIGITDTDSGKKEIWHLYHLESNAALKYEGNKLHHCVGDGYYWDQIKANALSIWSLRSSLLEPSLTLTLTLKAWTYTTKNNKDKTCFNGDLIAASGLLNEPITHKQAIIVRQALGEMKINICTFPQFMFHDGSHIVIEYCKKVGEFPAAFDKGNKDADQRKGPPPEQHPG